MQDLNDLYYFARVVEHGGFAPAGRALGVPKSTLSRRIALLEERLKSRLLQRSTRHFGMTEVGEVYYRHCVAMIAEAEAVLLRAGAIGVVGRFQLEAAVQSAHVVRRLAGGRIGRRWGARSARSARAGYALPHRGYLCA